MPPKPPTTLSPLAFANTVLGVQLWLQQENALNALLVNKRVAVKSGNGLGKGFCAAVAVLWFLYSHDPAIVLSTAPTFRQVRHILWREVRRLHRNAIVQLGGKMLETRWELSEDRYAMGLSAEGADQFQGFHSPNLLVVVDEAEGVNEDIYEAIEAIMTSAETRLLMIGNPTTVTGTFRKAFYQDRHLYHTITISALESPNVLEDRIVIPGMTTTQWVQEHREIWGEDNPIYRARVLGEFPDQAEDTLIRLSDIEAAARPKQSLPPFTGEGQDGGSSPFTGEGQDGGSSPFTGEGQDGGSPPIILAVDVARFGSDRSVILRRQGQEVQQIQTFRGMNTMQLTGWVAAAIQLHNPTVVYVDEIGVGAGVVDRLRELNHPVLGVNVARAARHSNIFANLRAEAFWHLRELFATGAIAIPADAQLMGELAAMKYTYDSLGRILIQSKDEIRLSGLPSPDKADALMLAFSNPGSPLQMWV